MADTEDGPSTQATAPSGRAHYLSWRNPSLERVELYNLFLASPELFCAELSRRLQDIDGHLTRIAEQLQEQAEALQTFLRVPTSAERARPVVTAWTYHAALPNRTFDTVFEPEERQGVPKQWVKRDGRIETELDLPRGRAFDIEIQVVDFVTPEAEASFALLVDDERVPWLSRDGWLFAARVGARPERSGMRIAFCVDPASVGEDRDVSFSFETIRIRAATREPTR